MQGGPHMHIIAAKAVCFGEALKPEFRDYQQRILDNARALADELQKQGLRVVSGGTDNHIVLVDVGVRGVTGRDAERALEKAGITVNKNTIPFDPKPPAVTSGVRLGTPALTTRGFGTDEMRRIARMIATVLDHMQDDGTIARVRGEVEEMCRHFPVPGIPA
jgi:glycine hydroxymethyltransferase